MKIFNKISIAVLAIVFMLGLSGASSAATAVNLGAADDFAILAGTGITFGGAVNTTTITGDIGTYLTPTITGIENVVLGGTNHADDATTQSAKTALTSAYNNAEGQTLPSVTALVASDIDSFSGTGYTLAPGVYNSTSTIGITGTLTLDGGGDPDAVFIFQAGSSLTTAGASEIVLINSAQACNVFWQVGSSATLGAASFLKGNILALTSIGLGTTANVEGRVLAQEGAVTLNGSNVVTKATCLAASAVLAQSSSGAQGNPPLISVKKVPTPLSLSAGPGQVTYNYDVLNIGPAPINKANLTVTDNKCSPVVYVSGDTNGNLILDDRQTETWKYRCTTTLSQTTTNTVTATGKANGYTAIDTANATVVVSMPVIPPLIHLVKQPNVFLLTAGGGAVTYTYTVTNPGTAPLSNVSVIDNKCTGLPGRVIGHPGDINKNNLLESNETWSFTCQTNLTKTTTNIGTAEGSANGLTAIDFSPSTVVVEAAVPKLPNTGFPPEKTNTLIILAGILALVLTSFVVIPRLCRKAL